ncbi:phytoene/squalene synthase family protein [Frigoribacterium sp. CFBP 8754]|uniref:phytoene/squalene synthase family protein n=1 Tax=unclassified Frigoribacterium TaxID=2627005 RepID=UPI00162A4B6E|nr:phytoene/squalene synthase family protein [Frigoribacterium sp. NBH87]MBD8661373.1 phytoene/squalene synthase family protein [Frigoribacterium sp. CFBP 8754]MBD8729218.1 phytoene/squalene synthase family protein [Frigoribacterium sp. CFBP 13707]QNE44118.1 phytoene/squalene synthase family protein [Frigoribacterium sp. NBH87]
MTGLSLYDAVADQTAAGVIRRYSTSFGLASRLLGSDVRQHVENVYALVRVADEIVDGPAAEAGLDVEAAGRCLDDYEATTERALAEGFSSDLVVHAFARTARATGFGTELTRPFFASMRADLSAREHDDESFRRYIYGSAEVVGLMCLRAFLVGHGYPASTRAALDEGACRLGAAFQKVNFLRDLAADFEHLGRSYFPGVDVDTFDEATKRRLVDDIDDDLRVAGEIIPVLPASSRRAVALAHGLFAELNRRLEATPASSLIRARVRVPNPVKLRIAAGAAVGRVVAVPPARTPSTTPTDGAPS